MALEGFSNANAVASLTSDEYDSVLVVAENAARLSTANNDTLTSFAKSLEKLRLVDATVDKEVSVLNSDAVPSHRFVFSPTGPLNRDYDDVRRFADAAGKALQRALKAGSKTPLLAVLGDSSQFPHYLTVGILSALHAAYVPLEIRESGRDKTKVTKLGVWENGEPNQLAKAMAFIRAVEAGRVVCRDIGGSDPERMAAPRVAEYVTSVLKAHPEVTVEVIDDQAKIVREYPLLGAVNRSAKGVTRHAGRVIQLTYTGAGPIEETLMLVGKGVTYDTGGADIKAGGIMAGMHRDKCGAASVAGFFKTLAELKPKGLKVVGAMSMVRNSVGSDCYVSDEIITSRAGVRVRVGNTDAEGRMAMADVLCQMKERAVGEVNPHLYTIATLTGHAVLAVGDNYWIVMDNGPAKSVDHAQKLQAVGDQLGDMIEISTCRREDYEFNQGKSEYEDLLQCNNAASSRTPRGHQVPMAFMVVASGLDKHGVDSAKPIKYSHIDIAPASGPFPGVPTGVPIVALAGKYILPRL